MGRRRERDLVDRFSKGREGYRITEGFELMEEDDDDGEESNLPQEQHQRDVLLDFPQEQSFLEE